MDPAPVNPFMPTVPTFAVRETDVSQTANVGTVGMNGLLIKGPLHRASIMPAQTKQISISNKQI